MYVLVRTSDFVLPDMRGGPSGAGGPGSEVQYTGAFVLPPTRGMDMLRSEVNVHLLIHTLILHTLIYVYIHVCIHLYIHVYICTNAHDIYYTGVFVLPPNPWDEYVYIHIYMYIYIYTHVYICMHIYARMHTRKHIYTNR